MEQRLKKLEKTVEQQGYLLVVLLIMLILDTAGVLLLWNQTGKFDFDHIAVSLSVFQILFGIAAVYGFWALRGLTKEKAEEVAAEEVAKIAPSLVLRQVEETMLAIRGGDTISADTAEDLVQAIGDEGKEDQDGK